MIGNFFHTPKSKSFNIPYRYYNPDKEEMEARERRIKRELGIQEEKEYNTNYRVTLKGSFRSSMGDLSKSAEEGRRKSNTRLIFLILILVLVFYLLFFHF